jgi:signal transduction histidine kinase/ligand-binding sensor domain-containing protein
VYQDRSGVLWIGAREGLYRFDRELEQATLITSERGWVEVIYEDRAGQLWIGTEDGYFSTLDRSSDQFIDYTIEAPPTSILEDHTGALWMGTYCAGLARFDPQTKQFSYYRHDPDDTYSLSDSRNCVMSVFEDRSGALWVGTGNGLNRYDQESGRFTHYQHDSSDPHSLSNGAVLSVYQDRSSVLWAGIEFGGINKLTAGSGKFANYRHITDDPNSLSGSIVTSVFEDQEEGVLWIGTVAGLDRLDRKNGQWKHYRHDPDIAGSLAHDLVRSIYIDRSGTLWVGSRGGLDRYDPEKDGFIHYDSPETMWIHEGASGTLWFATRGGLFRLDRDTGQLVFTKKAASWMIMVLEDRAGVVWVGTAGDGLYRYNPANGEWMHFGHDPDNPNSLANNGVEAIHEDDAGILWLATHGGLDRFEWETETFTHYRVQDGLANEYVTGILQERAPPSGGVGNLWLSTNGGLSRFDPGTETFKNYYVSDGLQSNLYWRNSYYQSPDGELFFGGQNGLSSFYPEQIADNPHPPPVVITAFSLFNQVVRTNLHANEQIELNYQENFLSFDFAALDYHNPKKNQYAYKLEGVDKDWVYGGARRHADYPNLSPGEYVFRVQGSNNDGVWNEEGIAVRITVKPPFWGTWWFRGLLLLALVGGVFGAYRWRVRSIEARSRELERQVEQRTTELEQEIEQRIQAEESLRQSEREQAITAERNRLARELHDSVTQSLYAATLYADATARLLPSGQTEMAAENVQKLRRTAREALGEMRLLIFELRPPILEEEGLLAALEMRLEAVEGRAGLQTALHVEGEGRLPPDIEQGLYRIALEALNNALKHARARSITVSLHLKPEVTILEVVDDGVGFEPAAVRERGGMGLRGMAERAEEMGGQLSIDSELGTGTTIRLEVNQ